MLKKTKLKAAIIGLGVGEQHILGYLSAGVEIAGLCDFNPEKLKNIQKRFPEYKIFSSADAVLENSDIDIISIASYDNHHATQVIKALKYKKHVFVEKPLCMTEQELQLIARELAKNPALRLSTNTILRMSERFRDLQSRISHNTFGEIFYLEADYNYGRLYKIQEGWRAQIPNYSVITGGGIHVVDLMSWIINSPVLEVSAMGNKFCTNNEGFQTPDMVVALLKFSNGVIGKISANFGCVYPHFHKLSVYGTKATFENRIDGGFIFQSRDSDKNQIKVSSTYPGLTKADLIPSFVSAIQGEGNAVVTERNVLNTMSICLAINRSLKTGQIEKVIQY
jgi:predicted dehydrogenase